MSSGSISTFKPRKRVPVLSSQSKIGKGSSSGGFISSDDVIDMFNQGKKTEQSSKNDEGSKEEVKFSQHNSFSFGNMV